jgi:hypothetical protein
VSRTAHGLTSLELTPHGLTFEGLAPEFRLFCLALRRPQLDADREALSRALAAGPDWQRIVGGGRRHTVEALLLLGLRASFSPHLPGEPMAMLRRQALAAARRSMAQSAVLARASSILAAAGIRVLALKGVALSMQLYGAADQRGPRDIDLLFAPDEVEQATETLVAAGFRLPGGALPPRHRAAYRRLVKDVQLADPTGTVRIELHHRLTDNPRLFDADFAALWREREEVVIGDTAVATLSRQHLPLYLCVHGASHAWERLCWLTDFAAAMRLAPAEPALAAARATGLEAPMLHALVLAHDWLGLPLAERHLAEACETGAVAQLDRVLAHSYAGDAWHQTPAQGSLSGIARRSLWQRLYRLRLKRDWHYRVLQAKREYASPADWDTVRLPDALFWLYPLVRPVGWLVRRWQR